MYGRTMGRGMRARVGLLFTAVAFVTVLPMCFGIPLFLGQTAAVVAESAPRESDYRLAEEYNRAAEGAGREQDVSAIEIAFARRLGKLDEVEEAAEHVYEGRLRANEAAPAPVTSHRRAKGAFYRDVTPEPASSGFPWREAVLGVVGLLMFVAAIGAALAAMLMAPKTPGPDDMGRH